MASRDGALARALDYFDSNGFRDTLAELVKIPSTSQDPGHEADVQRYLTDAIQPWLERMGFLVEIHPNPETGFGPILFAERLEGPDRPTILTYGHGDTVRGLDDQWRSGLMPWSTDRGRRSLVRPRHRRQQRSACAEPSGPGSGAGGTGRHAWAST